MFNANYKIDMTQAEEVKQMAVTCHINIDEMYPSLMKWSSLPKSVAKAIADIMPSNANDAIMISEEVAVNLTSDLLVPRKLRENKDSKYYGQIRADRTPVVGSKVFLPLRAKSAVAGVFGLGKAYTFLLMFDGTEEQKKNIRNFLKLQYKEEVKIEGRSEVCFVPDAVPSLATERDNCWALISHGLHNMFTWIENKKQPPYGDKNPRQVANGRRCEFELVIINSETKEIVYSFGNTITTFQEMIWQHEQDPQIQMAIDEEYSLHYSQANSIRKQLTPKTAKAIHDSISKEMIADCLRWSGMVSIDESDYIDVITGEVEAAKTKVEDYSNRSPLRKR